MIKSKTKRYDKARSMSIRWVAEKTGYTKEHIRATINKTYTGSTSDDILKAFKEKYEELQKVLS